MQPRIKNLIYGWRAHDDGLQNYMLGEWWADEPPGGTAVRVHMIPPRSLLREDGLVFDQYEAIVFAHDKLAKPLDGLGAFTDIVFEKKKVTVSFVVTATRIKYLEDAANALDVRPYKLEKVEVLRQGALYRWNELYSYVRAWADPELGPVDRQVLRALKKRRSPGSFEKRAGLDKPRLDAKKIMEGLAWLDKELAKFPVPHVGFYVNVHPAQRFVNFEAMDPGGGHFGYWLGQKANNELADHFRFDIENARRITNVLYQAKKWSSPELKRIELTDEH